MSTEAINSVNIRDNGSYENNQCYQSAVSAGQTIRKNIGNIFGGIADICGILGSTAAQASGPCFALGAYTSTFCRPYWSSFGWGWGYNPYFFYPTPVIFPSWDVFAPPPAPAPCNCGYSSPAPTSYNGGFSPSYSTDYSSFISPMNNIGYGTDAITFLDRAAHPGNYNIDGTPKTVTTTLSPKDKPLDLVDSTTGRVVTPSWYSELAAKKEQNKALSSEEEEIYQKYNKLYRTYSPYQLDENLGYKIDSCGQKVPSSLYDEFIQLQYMIEHKDRDSIENYISSCSSEKLAALELHYQTTMRAHCGGKTLREAIKDACIVSWFEWTGYNTDRCKRIFDKLDEAAMESPTNMHYALKQALENHRMGGFSFDEERLCSLLKKLEENKLFKNYVRKEYHGLITDINKKMFKNKETEDLLKQIFE